MIGPIKHLTFIALLAGLGGAQATVLTFDVTDYVGNPLRPNPTSMEIMRHYGDRVEFDTATVPEEGQEDKPFTYVYEEGNGFTPHIAFKIETAPDCKVMQYFDSHWLGVAFLQSSVPPGQAVSQPRQFYFTFTADPGFATAIKSFKVFGYLGQKNHEMEWSIRQSDINGQTLDSGTVEIRGNRSMPGEEPEKETKIEDNEGPVTITTAGKAYPGTVVLVIEHTKGSGAAFGLDDLNFDEVPDKK
jgi:hypothetical protein